MKNLKHLIQEILPVSQIAHSFYPLFSYDNIPLYPLSFSPSLLPSLNLSSPSLLFLSFSFSSLWFSSPWFSSPSCSLSVWCVTQIWRYLHSLSLGKNFPNLWNYLLMDFSRLQSNWHTTSEWVCLCVCVLACVFASCVCVSMYVCARMCVHPCTSVILTHNPRHHSRLYNQPTAMYESVATRWFKLSRTDTIRSCTNASLAFMKTMADPNASVSMWH